MPDSKLNRAGRRDGATPRGGPRAKVVAVTPQGPVASARSQLPETATTWGPLKGHGQLVKAEGALLKPRKLRVLQRRLRATQELGRVEGDRRQTGDGAVTSSQR